MQRKWTRYMAMSALIIQFVVLSCAQGSPTVTGSSNNSNAPGTTSGGPGGSGGSCQGDGNDSIACATPLVLSTGINTTIANSTDVDYYSLQVTDTEGVYTFLTYDLSTSVCSMDTVMWLLDINGVTALSANDNASTVSGPVPNPCSAINGTFNQAGKFFLKVAGSSLGFPNTGAYTVRASFTPSYIPYPSGVFAHWKLDNVNNGTTDSRGNINLTQQGTVPVSTGYFKEARGIFDRDNYYSAMHASLQQTYFIAEVWFKTSATTSDQRIFGNLWYGANTGWSLEIQAYDHKLRWAIGWGCSNPCSSSGTTNGTVTDGQWHYAVLAKINTTDPNKVRLYLDGVRQSSGDGTVTTFPTQNFIQIGRYDYSVPWPFIGSIDDVVFWSAPPTTWTEVDTAVANRWNGGSPRYYK